MADVRRFPGLSDETRTLLTLHTKDWSHRGVDPDRDLWEAKESWPDLEVIGDVIEARIGPVRVSDGTHAYMLGPYRVEIPLYRNARHVRDLGSKADLRPGYVNHINVSWPAGNVRIAGDMHCHPHVEDGEVCWGEGYGPGHDAFYDGRWGDLLSILESVLRTYNGRDRYAALVRWGRWLEKPGTVPTGNGLAEDAQARADGGAAGDRPETDET